MVLACDRVFNVVCSKQIDNVVTKGITYEVLFTTETDKGIYYYKTYDNFQINAVDMRKENLSGNKLITYPLIKTPNINYIKQKSDG